MNKEYRAALLLVILNVADHLIKNTEASWQEMDKAIKGLNRFH